MHVAVTAVKTVISITMKALTLAVAKMMITIMIAGVKVPKRIEVRSVKKMKDTTKLRRKVLA